MAVDRELLALIDEAREAGLRLKVDGPKLIIRGPETAEAIALRLIERKGEVRGLLRPSYMLPWPEILPSFARRQVGALSFCAGGPGNIRCPDEASTWVRYADVPTCLRCALDAIDQAVITPRSPSPKKVPA